MKDIKSISSTILIVPTKRFLYLKSKMIFGSINPKINQHFTLDFGSLQTEELFTSSYEIKRKFIMQNQNENYRCVF